MIMGMISMISLSGIGFAQEASEGVKKDETCKIEQRDMELKEYLMEENKSQKKPFKGMDMTDEEFEAKVQAKLERQAAQKGMGVDEYKEYLKEEYRAKREAFEKEAQENGMSANEYKQYLYEVKE